MKVSYFKTGHGYTAVTNRSPKGFKGVVFLGRGSDSGIEAIQERAWAWNQLAEMEEVPEVDVPDKWLLALGYCELMPVFDAAGENLLDLMPVPVGRDVPDRDTEIYGWLGCLAGMLIGAVWIVLFLC
jgi:hypothetical protein